MTCYNPIEITVKNPDTGNDRDIKTACRHCIGCLIQYQTDWQIRICNHATMTKNNQFVTLSLEDKHLPPNHLVDIRQMQLFHKRLRQNFSDETIQMIYKCEYSPVKLRPHYHGIYFGLPLDDLKHHSNNKFGHPLYTSKILTDIWGLGHVIIGAVTPQSAAYIARDINKTDKPNKAAQYKKNSQGIYVKDLKPIFQMSRNPGISKQWIDKFMWDVFPEGIIIQDGKKLPAPEYYVKQLEKLNPEMHALFLIKRHESIFTKTYKEEHRPQRLSVKETCLRAKLGKDPKKNEQF